MITYAIMVSEETQCPICRKEMGLNFPPVLNDTRFIVFPNEQKRDEAIKELRIKFPDLDFCSADIGEEK